MHGLLDCKSEADEAAISQQPAGRFARPQGLQRRRAEDLIAARCCNSTDAISATSRKRRPRQAPWPAQIAMVQTAAMV
jgi:hypothetical protein